MKKRRAMGPFARSRAFVPKLARFGAALFGLAALDADPVCAAPFYACQVSRYVLSPHGKDDQREVLNCETGETGSAALAGDQQDCKPQKYLVSDLKEDNGVLSKTTHSEDKSNGFEGTESMRIVKASGKLSRIIRLHEGPTMRIMLYEGACKLSG